MRAPISVLLGLILLPALPAGGVSTVAPSADHGFPPLEAFVPASERSCAPGESEHVADWPVPGHPDARVAIFTLCEGWDADESGPSIDSHQDCPSTAYNRLPFRQPAPYVGAVQNPSRGDEQNSVAPTTRMAYVLTDLIDAARAWDTETSATIYEYILNLEGFTSANTNVQNHIRWVSMGASSSTLAQTIIYYVAGWARDTDIEFNDDKPWTSSWGIGTGYYHTRAVAAHEFGHVFGLDHAAATSANACLTMYPYIAIDDDSKSTLGTGDILGIQAIYG